MCRQFEVLSLQTHRQTAFNCFLEKQGSTELESGRKRHSERVGKGSWKATGKGSWKKLESGEKRQPESRRKGQLEKAGKRPEKAAEKGQKRKPESCRKATRKGVEKAWIKEQIKVDKSRILLYSNSCLTK